MIPKKEFEREIVPRLNAQYKSEGCLSRFTVASYEASAVVCDINKKLRDIGFSISESVCDDGCTYYCYVNTVHVHARNHA